MCSSPRVSLGRAHPRQSTRVGVFADLDLLHLVFVHVVGAQYVFTEVAHRRRPLDGPQVGSLPGRIGIEEARVGVKVPPIDGVSRLSSSAPPDRGRGIPYRYVATTQSRGLRERSGPEPPRTQSKPPSPNLQVQPPGNVQLVSAIEPPPCRSTPRLGLARLIAPRASCAGHPAATNRHARSLARPPSRAVPHDREALAGLAESAAWSVPAAAARALGL